MYLLVGGILSIFLLPSCTLAGEHRRLWQDDGFFERELARRKPHGPIPVYSAPEVDPFPRRLAGLHGDANCPCVNPWEAYGGIPRNLSFVDPKTNVGCIKYLPDNVATPFCYPLDYGSKTCNAWDNNLQPWCANADGAPHHSAPAYCKDRWCYVNRSNCGGRIDAKPTHAFAGFDLWYSYETCGSVDNFAIDLLAKSLRGRVLKVGLPGTEPPFIDVTDDPAAPNGVRVGGMTHDFLQELAKTGGFTLEFVKGTKESRSVFPQSSYSACVRDVALHRVDFCAGVFYETPERRSMATFTPSYFPDLFSLIVFTKGRMGAFEMLGKVFAPFSPVLWAVIAGLAGGVGFAFWVFGEVPDTPPVRGSMIGARQAAMKFLGQGKDHDATTKGGQIVLLGFSFLCMLGASSYTANLSSFLLMSDLDTDVKDIFDAIEQQKKVCALEPLKGLMLGKYPGAEKIMVWVGWFDKAMEKMDAGECDGMLLNENEYARMFGNIDFWGSTGNSEQHCTKMRVGDIVLSVPVGFPIRREIEQAIGYLMVKAQANGHLEEIMAKYPPPDPECDHADGLKAEAMALEPSDLVGVIILTLLTLGLGFFLHHLDLRARRAHKELTKKGGLVRKSRFDRVKKRFSGDSQEPNAFGESLNDADVMVDEVNMREDDTPKPPPHFDEDNCNSDDEHRGQFGQPQDMGLLGKEVATIVRQVGLLTEVVGKLRDDIGAVRQHHMNDVDMGPNQVDRPMPFASSRSQPLASLLDLAVQQHGEVIIQTALQFLASDQSKIREVDMGAKLVDRELTDGAVSLISASTPVKQADSLSAASSVEQPQNVARGSSWSEKAKDVPWSEKVRERPPDGSSWWLRTVRKVNL